MASYKSKAKRKIKNKMRKSPIIITIVIILAIIGVLLFAFGDKIGIDLSGGKESGVTAPKPADGEVLFHFIDVGQGDAILVTTKSGNMLIDSGDLSDESRDSLVGYLKAAKVDSFKYVIFTHTDADHIGSADYVIENYDVENVIMPDYEATTQVYDRLIKAMEKKNTNLVLIGEDEEVCEQSGYTFYLGSMLNTVIAPTEDFNDPNEMSVVLKSTYGETSVMFTGDAEKESEEAILKTWKASELKCDVLKVGHHGSSTSTTKEFLEAVDPTIAVISCGEGNKYGHPHKETIEKLEGAGVTILRTDLLGHIVIKSDGKTVTVVE